MQLGTYVVIIKFKNVKKNMCVFCSSENGQVLLGIPDMAALNIINLNIESVQAEVAECKTNIGQQMQIVSEVCTNTATGDHTT